MLWLDEEINEYIGRAGHCASDTAPARQQPGKAVSHPGQGALPRDSLDKFIVSALCASVKHMTNNSHFYKKHLADYESVIREFTGRAGTAKICTGSAAKLAVASVSPNNSVEIAGCHGYSDHVSSGRHGENADNAVAENGLSLKQALSLLDRLPFTTAADLALNPEAFLCVGQDEVAGLISVPTSGTTGQRKRVFCSSEDLRRTVRFFAYGMRYLVPSVSGRRVMLLMSGEREGSVGHLLSRALGLWGIECDVYGFPSDLRSCQQHINAVKPHCLVGLPSHIMAVCRLGLAPQARASLQSVLLSGEWASPVIRAFLEDYLQCPVFLHYGLTESGLAGAVECPARNGCHIREADMLISIVDRNGRAVPDGQWGEIVLTTLSRQATPLLRYKTGDRGRILGGQCSCGSYLKRLEAGERMEQRISLPDGTYLGFAQLDSLLFPLPWLVGYEVSPQTDFHGTPFLALELLTSKPAGGGNFQDCINALSPLPVLEVVDVLKEGPGTPEGFPFWHSSYSPECCGSGLESASRGSFPEIVPQDWQSHCRYCLPDLPGRLPVVVYIRPVKGTAPMAHEECASLGCEDTSHAGAGFTPDKDVCLSGRSSLAAPRQVLSFDEICRYSLDGTARMLGKRVIRNLAFAESKKSRSPATGQS